MELRPHQTAALAAIRSALAAGGHPAAQLATGTGKSLILADLARHSGVRTWVLTHSQQLVQQNADTYERYTGMGPGVVCAGLGRRDLEARVTIGTVQSIIGPVKQDALPPPELIIVDEAHRVNHRTGEVSMYGEVFARHPGAQRVALTATAWRTDNGLIYGAGESYWFDSLCYRYTVPQGVADGWLSPLVGVETEVQLELPPAPLTEDYNPREVGEREDSEWLGAVARSLPKLARTRQHIAVYCPSVVAMRRAELAVLRHTGWSAITVYGAMPPAERERAMQQFLSGEARVLLSVDTLTTGFDFPALDCIVCLRPTAASNLWVQILGRGTRRAEGKRNCLVLDYVGNLQRLGGVDALETYVRERAPLEPLEALPAPTREPRKVWPGVTSLVPLDPTTGAQAREGATLRVQVHNVNAVALNTRRGPALMVQYTCTTPENARVNASAFITTSTLNPAAQEFFQRRRLAVQLPNEPQRLGWALKGAPQPTHVTVRKAGRYWNVVREIWETQDEHF